MIADRRPDLVLIDWMLPDSSGLELTRAIKRNADTSELPIIMVTARAEESDKVAGLVGGADDYVTKPFSPRELHARIAALLRRSTGGDTGRELRVGLLLMDCAAHRVSVGGAAVDLGPTEYRLLEFFLRNPERVYSRVQLLDSVWGGNVYIAERTVDVHIRRLRKCLQSVGVADYVQTVRGSGYRVSIRTTA
jgi:two-component system phosphate regulon response regulator PhoB